MTIYNLMTCLCSNRILYLTSRQASCWENKLEFHTCVSTQNSSLHPTCSFARLTSIYPCLSWNSYIPKATKNSNNFGHVVKLNKESRQEYFISSQSFTLYTLLWYIQIPYVYPVRPNLNLGRIFTINTMMSSKTQLALFFLWK